MMSATVIWNASDSAACTSSSVGLTSSMFRSRTRTCRSPPCAGTILPEVSFTQTPTCLVAIFVLPISAEIDFVRANLRNADLRRSTFEACDFTDADMHGAKLTREQADQIVLSDDQQQVIDWQESDGEEPSGG